MGGILIARQNFENQIREDIDHINDMFGTDIKFTWGVKRDTEIEVNENNQTTLKWKKSKRKKEEKEIKIKKNGGGE